MLKKTILTLLCFFALTVATAVTASADFGPKPSVVVTFDGLEHQYCYVTLLSKTESTGPYSAFKGDPESGEGRYEKDHKDYSIWQAFASYKDADGFYFLQFFTRLGGDGIFRWSYFPPAEFKILVYFPETDTFAVGDGIYDRYAFDSYYTVDASGLGTQPAEDCKFGAVRSYDHRGETVSLIARIAITIVLEVGIALLFGFRRRKQLLIIGVTNVVTQTVLNILLNIINFHQGRMAFILNYIWMEILVFAIEAWVYSALLGELDDQGETKKRHPVLYAFAANLFSFIAGLVLSRFIPGIF